MRLWVYIRSSTIYYKEIVCFVYIFQESINDFSKFLIMLKCFNFVTLQTYVTMDETWITLFWNQFFLFLLLIPLTKN